ncbi:hypothetical protein C3747_31g192 [Trypanosoma cruzi]|uniref:Uncharacterized protein n=2 Tax=Trypanosoma cruzi TaxID=5693 RepID=Q4DSS2_TRYCC|nr:hypothetical protein, conserved [Trypanosoma cruzi]EAN95571.1 hypothetical protein, conserved [Trypanosoma cruzi]PWV15153.1 hypothetical protein C3747_31g192 [Trypanosoma cruzi]RNC61505.1 hypothetical protein TcCL_ESM00788 [Trypanosoma cruzi]|eukprot:XP_817422.1 hypothetical protein [Trypanosoma cruzi strain CL Brener]
MPSATESLRWVKYDDVYYASLIVPDHDAPMPVESGHVFVYFLGTESGAVVPIGDTSPYDPHDTSRTSHPAAAAGVLVAQQIIAGAEAAAQEELSKGGGEETGGGRRKAKEREIPKKKEKSGKTKHHRKEDLNVLRRRAAEEEEEEMEAEVEEAEEDRVLENTLSMRNKRSRRNQKERDQEEEENALLQIDAYRGSKKSHVTVEDEEQDQEQEEEDSKRSNNDVSNEELDQRNRWDDMAEDLNLTMQSSVGGGRGSHARSTNKRHADAYPVSLDSGSIVVPFLAEIRHYYRAVLQEAVESDRIVNLQEAELVRMVESALLQRRGELIYVQQMLQDVEAEYHTVAGGDPSYASDRDTALLEEAEALRSQLAQLKSSFDIEDMIKKHLHLRDKLPERRERKRSGVAAAGNSTFADASLAFVLDAQASTAMPRELTQQLAHRYREQRVHRERLLASQYGIGKIGFSAPVTRVMEKWRQSRELMVLDPRRESQPVSRRYSESLAKVERHAIKCLSAAKGSSNQLFSLYLLQQGQRQPQRTSRNLYNFHEFHEDEEEEARQRQTTAMYQVSSSHPYTPIAGMQNNTDDIAHDTFQAPLISPLRTSFDPRATFAVDMGEIRQGNTLAEQLAMQSMQYSHSICLPSQESVWENSEAYEGAQRRRTGRSMSRAGSMSRVSSRASSVAREHTDATFKKNSTHRNNNNNNNNVKNRNERHSRNDWRASAKRAILEQLTLYLRGIRGKPTVLNKDQFQFVAKKLLERAVRIESERTGISMSLQANNANAPFTKEIEARLRKSVDNYVVRHFVTTRTPEPQKRNRGADIGTASMDQWVTSTRDMTRKQEDGDETRSLMGAYPHSHNSPVYDEW